MDPNPFPLAFCGGDPEPDESLRASPIPHQFRNVRRHGRCGDPCCIGPIAKNTCVNFMIKNQYPEFFSKYDAAILWHTFQDFFR